jgi:multidrug resistance protein, MATE family
LKFLKTWTLKRHFKANISLAYPVMLSQLGHILVGVADSIMVGQLGAEPLAAASLANSIFSMVLTFGIGISYAITPFVAKYDGENNLEKSSEVLRTGFWINAIAGVALFIIVTGSSFVLHYLNQPADVVDLAIPYLGIITFSLVPFMFFQSFKQFAEGLSLTKVAMAITVGANLINIGLNYILIFGKMGFEPMGLNGAGIATLLSRVMMALGMFYYIAKSKKLAKYKIRLNIKGVTKKLVNQLLKIGLPTGVQFIFEVGAFSFAAIMMGWMGAETLAAHQIAINLAAVSYMTATGISAAATVRVGNQLGKNDIPTLRMAGFTSFAMGIAFMTITCIIFITGNFFLPSLYIDDMEVINIAASLLIIAGFFQISDGIQVVGLGALRGLGDVKVPTVITLIAYWVLGLPVGYLLCFQFGLGPEGIWYGLLIGLSVAAVLLFTRFNYISRKLLRTRSTNMAI